MKIKRTILTIVMCIVTALVLGGCTSMFDLLNFNRSTLPSVESEIEPGLKNEQILQRNAMSKAEFSAAIVNLQKKMKGSCNETVQYDWQNFRRIFDAGQSFHYANKLSRTIVTVDREALASEEADPDFPYGKPFAQFSQTIESRMRTQLFFEDAFVNYQYGAGYGNRYTTDGYGAPYLHPEYDIVSNGSILLRILAMYEKNFSSIDIDWENGKNLYKINCAVGADNVGELFDAVQFDMGILGQSTEAYIGLGTTLTVEGTGADRMITGIRTKVQFRKETLIIQCDANAFAQEQIEIGNWWQTDPASLYYARQATNRIVGNERSFRAAIALESADGEEQYVHYLTVSPDNDFGYDSVQLSDGRMLHSTPHGLVVEEKDGKLTVLAYDDPLYDIYRNMLTRVYSMLGTQPYYIEADGFTLTQTQETYTLQFDREFYEYPWESDPVKVGYERYIYVLSKTDHVLLSYRYEHVYGLEEDRSETVQTIAFSYDFDFVLPDFSYESLDR